MKKEELNYFDNFIKNSNYALEISKILKEFLQNYDLNKAEEYENKVHNIENEADKNLHNILSYLIKDFLPPIDREDIITLVYKIDDVVDNVDELVTNLNILNVKTLREDIENFAELLLECYEKLVEMLEKFKNIKKYNEIKDAVIAINKLEEKGDLLYQKAIKNIYENPSDPIEVIVWSNIYNGFENCFDSCEEVSECVEQIIMKNS